MRIASIFKQFKWRLSLTLLLLLMESGLYLLYPLCIGYAVNYAIETKYFAIWWLVGLSLSTLLVGALRRYYDTRVYAYIYKRLAIDINFSPAEMNTSKKAAAMQMLNELINFFEHDIPGLIGQAIGLIGTVIILSSLQLEIFYLCLAVLFISFLIYLISGKRTLKNNIDFNNELERQVDVLQESKYTLSRIHFKRLMFSKIRLSDIETLNFSLVWIIMTAVLGLSLFIIGQQDSMLYGSAFALLMYVFQFMESTMALPLYYQQYIRLKEIGSRLSLALTPIK